jgi:hypothetical protein
VAINDADTGKPVFFKPLETPKQAAERVIADVHAGMLEGAKIEEVKIARYAVSVEPGDKYRLELYPLIAGKAGKYPELKMVSDKERMWAALEPVWDDVLQVPNEGDVTWLAEWKEGREYEGKDGKTKHYKDLVAVRMA